MKQTGCFVVYDRELDSYEIEQLVMTNYDFGNYSASLLTLDWKGESK